ncbi:kinase-like protein [Ceratobasidium sp. AG-I]|nr:kinase-like protein [Ceratobasidium sp. AG-I]
MQQKRNEIKPNPNGPCAHSGRSPRQIQSAGVLNHLDHSAATNLPVGVDSDPQATFLRQGGPDGELFYDNLFHNQTWGVRDVPSEGRDKFRFWKGRYDFQPHHGYAEIWYQHEGHDYYVRVVDQPGTLAHSILACKTDIPQYGASIEIIGNDVHPVSSPPQCPAPPQPDEDDSEDCTQELNNLPLIQVDEQLHFTKATSYQSEVQALLKCRGSSRIVQLLGRSISGELVFPKHGRHLLFAAMALPIAGKRSKIKKWMLDLIDAVAELHAMGIIHRDLVLRNILEADPLIVCDLQCRYSSFICRAPEVMDWETAQYSAASDVYALGYCLREMCYANTPFTPFADYPVPPPFDVIFSACTRARPEDRPSIGELREMLARTSVSGFELHG